MNAPQTDDVHERLKGPRNAVARALLQDGAKRIERVFADLGLEMKS